MHSMTLSRLLLPTPRANKVNGCNLNSENLANRNKGNLEEMIAKMMLPTPAAADVGQNNEQQQAEEPKYPRPGWELFPTQSPVCGRDDGLSDRLVGIAFPKWRTESIKAYGNAIVPQVAYEIFKAINKYEQNYGQD